MHQKYDTLVNVLDQLRREAPAANKRYRPLPSQRDRIDQARARAFIHLYLKVQFGLLDFEQRERLVSDGPDDGGIDAYFIDSEGRKIYFVQSKFRTTEKNFSAKNIALDDLLHMDIERITRGETTDESGKRYNGKIQDLIREIQKIENIARYEFVIVLLANVPHLTRERRRKLLGEFPVEVYDHERCYRDLVFPVVSGTYYNAADLTIYIDLSGKEMSQARIRYPVETEFAECEITLLFVPTVEIAKILYKYRNSILRFNPRSYLSLSKNPVNREIAATVQERESNEFSLRHHDAF